MGFCTFLTNVGSKKLIELLAEDIQFYRQKFLESIPLLKN